MRFRLQELLVIANTLSTQDHCCEVSDWIFSKHWCNHCPSGADQIICGICSKFGRARVIEYSKRMNWICDYISWSMLVLKPLTMPQMLLFWQSQVWFQDGFCSGGGCGRAPCPGDLHAPWKKKNSGSKTEFHYPLEWSDPFGIYGWFIAVFNRCLLSATKVRIYAAHWQTSPPCLMLHNGYSSNKAFLLLTSSNPKWTSMVQDQQNWLHLQLLWGIRVELMGIGARPLT